MSCREMTGGVGINNALFVGKKWKTLGKNIFLGLMISIDDTDVQNSVVVALHAIHCHHHDTSPYPSSTEQPIWLAMPPREWLQSEALAKIQIKFSVTVGYLILNWLLQRFVNLEAAIWVYRMYAFCELLCDILCVQCMGATSQRKNI